MKADEIKAKMYETANRFGNVHYVLAEICGEQCELEEEHVRALQVMCKQAAEKSDEDWLEFVRNVIIYNSHPDYNDESLYMYKPYCLHMMEWNKDGTFANEFDFADGSLNGFFNRNSDLVFEIL